MEIKRLDGGRKSDWDAFVTDCTEASFFHRAGWQEVIERAFGHETHYLFAEEEGRIVGVLPLGHVKSVLFGNALISNPFCVYGGAATESDAARKALEQGPASLHGNWGSIISSFATLNRMAPGVRANRSMSLSARIWIPIPKKILPPSRANSVQ